MGWRAERTADFDEWWATLSDSAQRKVVAAVDVLEELGPTVGRPLADSVAGSRHSNMKELRVTQTIRIFFAFDRNRVAILLVGGDKGGKTKRFYRRMIPKADRIYDAHLRSGARERGYGKRKTFQRAKRRGS